MFFDLKDSIEMQYIVFPKPLYMTQCRLQSLTFIKVQSIMILAYLRLNFFQFQRNDLWVYDFLKYSFLEIL